MGQGRTRLIIDGPWGIQLQGKVGSLEVHDLTIDMQGKGTGIGCNSGAEVGRFRAQRVEVLNGDTGISANADLGGSFRDVKIRDCFVHDMNGAESGSGYGIHAAQAMLLEISGNRLERCGRHSIYQAKSPKGQPGQVSILNNKIFAHRGQIGDVGAIRCAIVVSRSNGVIVEGNQVEGGFGGALEISEDNWPCSTVLVRGNQFTGRKETVPYIWIGKQEVPQGTPVENITLDGNYFDTLHNGTAMNPDILLANGLNIVIKNGTHRHRGEDGLVQRAITLGHSGYAKLPAHLDRVYAHGNTFLFDGPQFAANTRDYSIDGPLRFESAQKLIEGGRIYMEA
jgi:hypothetical protein